MRFLTPLFFFLILTVQNVQADACLPIICMGKPNAPIAMIDYSSLTCTHCAEFHKTILPVIIKKYVKPGHVRLIIRDFPGDKVALLAHQLSWCKGEAEYLNFVKLFYAKQDEWLLAKDPAKALKEVVLKNGFTPKQFKACVQNAGLMNQIIQGRLKGQKQYSIKSTPTLVINANSVSKVYQRALTLEEVEAIFRPILEPKSSKKSSEEKS